MKRYMGREMAIFSFEVPFVHVQAHVDADVSAIFATLESEFLVLPKGQGFIEYAVFEMGYEALKRATSGFTSITPPAIFDVALGFPITLIVLSTILGFTPPEWAYVMGADTLRTVAGMGVPYAMLLYERFPGHPFAGHRDSVSELVGDSLESAIEDVLTNAGISYRKTKRAERVLGFDQAPDFIIPSEFNPQVVIEAKITEDDGTARDKVTRVQHLCELSLTGRPSDQP